MNVIDNKPHAVLGPSGWDRWSTCPGSVVLEEGRPNPTSVYAAWGTVAHEIAAECLVSGEDPESYVGRTYKVEEHDIPVDMEMADAVNDYMAHVRAFVPEDGILLVEQEVPIGHLTGERGATGTSDVVGIVNDGTRLVIVDAKFGKGVEVFAEGNGQMKMYALGALEKFGFIHEDIAEVEIVIVQPRIDNVTSELMSVDDLRAFGDEVTMAAGRVELAKSFFGEWQFTGDERGHFFHNEFLLPTEKACKFCRAKSICPALGAEVSSSMALVSAADPLDFADLTLPKQAASVVVSDQSDVDRLAAFMRAAPLIEEAVKAVRAEVERRLLGGEPVPGFKIVQGKKGNRQWIDPEHVEVELKKRLGAKDAYVKKLISVTEAEKAFKARPKVWAKIAPLITQAEGKPSVAPESDPRPVMQLGAAPEDFPDLTALEEAVGDDESIRLEIQRDEAEMEALRSHGVTAHDLFDD